MADEQLLGYWFVPGGQPWAGNLAFSESGNIELTVLSNEFLTDIPHYDMIHGFAGKDRYTLIGVQGYSLNYSFGSAGAITNSLYVRTVIKGVHLSAYDQPFPRFSFSVEGLQDWTTLSGVETRWIQVGESEDLVQEFSYRRPSAVEIASDEFGFRIFATFQNRSPRWGFEFQEDTQIHVTAKTPRTIDEWMGDIVVPFQKLVQTSVKTGGNLQRLAVSSKMQDTGGGAADPDWLNIRRITARHYPFETKRRRLEQPILNLSDFVDNKDTLQKWIHVEKAFGEPLTAVANAELGEPTIEYVLFVHSRLLERLVGHYPKAVLCDRATMKKIAKYAKTLVEEENRTQVGQKLGDILRNDARAPLLVALRKWIPQIGDWKAAEEELEWIAYKIVKTRNHFAHQGDERPDPKQIQPGEHRVFLALVQTLIDFEIAERLGIPIDKVKDRLSDSAQWRNARIVKEIWKDVQEAAATN